MAEMSEQEILQKANEMIASHGLTAEILPDLFSVGVQGDGRTYTPILNLIGPHPGNDVLKKLSTELSNNLPINRVTIQI